MPFGITVAGDVSRETLILSLEIYPKLHVSQMTLLLWVTR